MDSVNLLVVDQTPESSEQINSLLRNSGIKIHVIHVSSYAEVNRAFDAYSPLLVIYLNPDPVDAGIEEISELAGRFSVPCALLIDLEDHQRLTSLIRTAPCYVVDKEAPDHLIATVSGLLETQTRLQDSQAQESRLDEIHHRYELLLESARDAIAYIHEGLHVYANRAYLEALHVGSAEELQGMSLLEIMKIPDGNLKSVLRDLSKSRFPSSPLEVEVSRPDGSTLQATLDFSAATFNGESCIQMMLQERDQAAELAAELDRLRVTDPLTQLANRSSFTAQLASYIESNDAEESAAALLYLEPDALDEAQDEVGMAAVDEHVSQLAGVVREYLESSDIGGRISDHGIAILVNRGKKQQIEGFIKAIQHAYRNVIVESGGKSFSASCSVGMVSLGRLANDAQSVIAQARKACSEALSEGEAIVVFRPQLTAVAMAEEESTWVDRIRFALKNEDFHAVQQSIVDLDGEGEHLLENLVHLRGEESDHPYREFAEIAERHDLAGNIDRSVIPSILRSIADTEERQIIALSNHSIAEPGFAAWLLDHLKMYAVNPRQVVVQVSADLAQANLKPTQRLMRELAPAGCQLSISGFGSERRTLQLFEHLQASYVKLDTALTTELQGNNTAQSAIQQVVEAANEHNVVVIADEISDTSNLAVLWQCGVKMIAGAFLKETSQVVGQ